MERSHRPRPQASSEHRQYVRIMSVSPQMLEPQLESPQRHLYLGLSVTSQIPPPHPSSPQVHSDRGPFVVSQLPPPHPSQPLVHSDRGRFVVGQIPPPHPSQPLVHLDRCRFVVGHIPPPHRATSSQGHSDRRRFVVGQNVPPHPMPPQGHCRRILTMPDFPQHPAPQPGLQSLLRRVHSRRRFGHDMLPPGLERPTATPPASTNALSSPLRRTCWSTWSSCARGGSNKRAVTRACAGLRDAACMEMCLRANAYVRACARALVVVAV